MSDTAAELVARWFHEEYERLAPSHGYETRRDSAVPWEEVPETNRALMVATAAAVLDRMDPLECMEHRFDWQSDCGSCGYLKPCSS